MIPINPVRSIGLSKVCTQPQTFKEPFPYSILISFIALQNPEPFFHTFSLSMIFSLYPEEINICRIPLSVDSKFLYGNVNKDFPIFSFSYKVFLQHGQTVHSTETFAWQFGHCLQPFTMTLLPSRKDSCKERTSFLDFFTKYTMINITLTNSSITAIAKINSKNFPSGVSIGSSRFLNTVKKLPIQIPNIIAAHFRNFLSFITLLPPFKHIFPAKTTAFGGIFKDIRS